VGRSIAGHAGHSIAGHGKGLGSVWRASARVDVQIWGGVHRTAIPKHAKEQVHAVSQSGVANHADLLAGTDALFSLGDCR